MLPINIVGVLIAGAVAFLLAWIDGANNAGNSLGTLIGAKALPLRRALIVAGVAELVGGVLYGSFISETILRKVVNPVDFNPLSYAVGLTVAMFITFLLIFSVTRRRIPFSITQTLIGALTGFSLGNTGGRGTNLALLSGLLALWIVLPILGIIAGLLSYKLYEFFIGFRKPWMIILLVLTYLNIFIASSILLLLPSAGLEYYWYAVIVVFIILNALPIYSLIKTIRSSSTFEMDSGRVFPPEALVLSSGMMAFTHGAHDVANSAAPFTGVIAALSLNSIPEDGLTVNPLILLICSGGLSAGIVTWGLRVARTIGEEITVLNNDSAFIANFSASLTTLFLTRMGLPSSMTGLVIGSITGVGLAKGIGNVNLKLVARIMGYWYLGFALALAAGFATGLALTIL
ncbi:MAG: inorganic phosphate transporter [Thermosphaera sp.]